MRHDLALTFAGHRSNDTVFEWKTGQGLHRKPHAERRAKPEHRTGEDAGEAHP